MIRIRYILVLFVFSLFIYALFQVKFQVQELHREAFELKRELRHEKDAIHVLKAEWAYLNQPERLQRLSEKFLDLKEVKPNQLPPTKEQYLITPKELNIASSFNVQPVVKVSYEHNSKSKVQKNKSKGKWNYRKRPTIKSRPKK